ncbi:MAG: histidinol-phosphate transaminase [Lachnospiraceae bacterium]|nr:histidinol-phosphate transaminase [Lachnospiraceae bacterium]
MMSWENNIHRVVPYVPGEQPTGEGIIKLNTNENPYPPAPGVEKALRDMADDYAIMRKYPDPEAGMLVRALSDYYNVPDESIFVGVGSDDVLAMSFLTFFDSDKPLLFPDITYSFYEVWADLFRIPHKQIPLRGDFTIDPEAYMQMNGGIVIANPNAPTSLYLDIPAIESIIAANLDSVVIVDEAYIDFGGESALPLIKRYDNLLVVRTFSKSRSMAGARVGMAFGSPRLISYLKDVKFSINSYTMSHDVIRMGAASAALSDKEYFEDVVERIIATRTDAAARLRDMGFKVLDSSTNFLFVTHPDHRAGDIYSALKERRIYVRYFNRPRIDDHLRITIGTPEEMESLYAALKEIFDA